MGISMGSKCSSIGAIERRDDNDDDRDIGTCLYNSRVDEFLFRVSESGDVAALTAYLRLDSAGQRTPQAVVLNDVRDSFGFTPFMYAAMHGHIEVLELFTNAGYNNVNAAAHNGSSALVLAARYGRVDVVSWLLACEGIDLEAKCHDDGATALLQAVDLGNSLTAHAILEQLVARNANIEARNRNGMTALLVAATRASPDHLHALKYLLTQKVDMEAKDSFGNTALILLATTCSEALTAVVLAKADINATNYIGQTALMVASQRGFHHSVKCLLSLGADVTIWSSVFSENSTFSVAYRPSLGYTVAKEKAVGSAVWMAALYCDINLYIVKYPRNYSIAADTIAVDAIAAALLRRFGTSVLMMLPRTSRPINTLPMCQAELNSPWYSRVEYLKLFDGCPGPSLQGHIVRYLFDDIACREICAFLGVIAQSTDATYSYFMDH